MDQPIKRETYEAVDKALENLLDAFSQFVTLANSDPESTRLDQYIGCHGKDFNSTFKRIRDARFLSEGELKHYEEIKNMTKDERIAFYYTKAFEAGLSDENLSSS